MIKLISTLDSGNDVTLGNICEFSIIKSEPNTQTRSFLIHQNLFYPKPLNNWTAENYIRIFPEAPGEYTLIVEWRARKGKKGRIQHPFKVITDVDSYNYPQTIQIDPTRQLLAPSDWEAKQLSYYEKPVFDRLSSIVKPGWVVYDVGANLGIYTLQFSSLVAQDGFVYSIEANPVCIYFLRANLEKNISSNCQIIPIALTNGQKQVAFTINYSNSALGLTQSSPFYQSKIGHEISVHGLSLDDLISDYQLRIPDLIKIDVEGAEGFVVSGMQSTINKHHPLLLIEIHGREAARITAGNLKKHNYNYQDLVTQELFSNEAQLIAWFPESVRQLLCTPK